MPIIADDYVDKEFGTGVVKITLAHDFNDYEVGKRHNLPLFNIFDRGTAVLLPISAFPTTIKDWIVLPLTKIVAQAEAEGWLEKLSRII